LAQRQHFSRRARETMHEQRCRLSTLQEKWLVFHALKQSG
jgi:hypothetical protein